jgi:HNH endonuclease
MVDDSLRPSRFLRRLPMYRPGIVSAGDWVLLAPVVVVYFAYHYFVPWPEGEGAIFFYSCIEILVIALVVGWPYIAWQSLGGALISALVGGTILGAAFLRTDSTRMVLVEAGLLRIVRTPHPRQRIPQRIRHEVWRRDGGCCAECGSGERLEIDHIVPVSKGGSSTPQNLELLCQGCNRRKGNRI